MKKLPIHIEFDRIKRTASLLEQLFRQDLNKKQLLAFQTIIEEEKIKCDKFNKKLENLK